MSSAAQWVSDDLRAAVCRTGIKWIEYIPWEGMQVSTLKSRITNAVVSLTGDSKKLPHRLHTIAHLGKHLAPTAGHRRLLTQLERAVEENHPGLQLIAKMVEQTSRPYHAAVARLFVEHAWEGYWRRKQFQKEHGLFPPSFIVLSPLAACNLKCQGCYAGAYGHQEPMLSYGDIERIIREVRGWGSYFITVSGGEPTLLWRQIPGEQRGLRDLAREYQDMGFLMYTNGTLITHEMAAEMAELGNVSPALSIEGYREQTDGRRGDGVFDRLVEATEILRRHKVLFGASVTYTQRNVDVVASDEFIEFLIDRGFLYAWYFMYVPVGRAPDLSLMVTPEQRRHVARKTYEWLTRRPIFVADFWNSGPLVGGCIAAGRPNGYLHVNHRGDITPCVFMMYSTHNLHQSQSETPLLDALRSPFFEHLRARQRGVQHNPLAPCLIVDHPEVLREAVQATGAQSTQEGQTILTELQPEIAKRADEWQRIADELWHGGSIYQGCAEAYREGTLPWPGTEPVSPVRVVRRQGRREEVRRRWRSAS